MKCGFYTVFRRNPEPYVLAEILVRSVRATMPGVEIVHLTDDTSPPVHGVDTVVRKPVGKMLERRIEHYADCHGDWLLLDTDVVVRKDVRDVFVLHFSVALTDRNWPHMAVTPDLTAKMPYNTGVVFSREPEFWVAVLKTWRAFPQETQASWMSEQMAVAKVAEAWPELAVLPGSVYNYPPAREGDESDAAIVHFKGQRKAWMRKLWAQQVLTCA
jgi:hypothetical protein